MPVCQEEVIATAPMGMHALERDKCSLAIEVLRGSGVLRLRADGYSMLPTLWPGDFLTIRTKSFEQIQVGEIALCVRDGRFVVHRVVHRQAGLVIIRGDSMPQEDPAMLPEQVLGVVTQVWRGGKVVRRETQRSLARRTAGRLLGQWDLLQRVVIRWHGLRCKHGKAPNSPLSSGAPDLFSVAGRESQG